MCDSSQIVHFWGGDMSYTNELSERDACLPESFFIMFRKEMTTP